MDVRAGVPVTPPAAPPREGGGEEAVMDCGHATWTVLDFELSTEAGGPYAIFMLRCRDCGQGGEFSDHILNVIHEDLIEWQTA